MFLASLELISAFEAWDMLFTMCCSSIAVRQIYGGVCVSMSIGLVFLQVVALSTGIMTEWFSFPGQLLVVSLVS